MKLSKHLNVYLCSQIPLSATYGDHLVNQQTDSTSSASKGLCMPENAFKCQVSTKKSSQKNFLSGNSPRKNFSNETSSVINP